MPSPSAWVPDHACIRLDLRGNQVRLYFGLREGSEFYLGLGRAGCLDDIGVERDAPHDASLLPEISLPYFASRKKLAGEISPMLLFFCGAQNAE
jgi:hypothetical protein